MSACKEPEKYLYGGKLNLRNFYVSFFNGNFKNNYNEMGIERMNYLHFSEFVKNDFVKFNYNLFFYLNKDFKDYFGNYDKDDKDFIKNEINKKRKERNLELIVLE